MKTSFDGLVFRIPRPLLGGLIASFFCATLAAQIPLTVTGITAANKVYDGTTTATLNTAGAVLGGTIAPGDDVTLVATGAIGTFASAGVGTNQTVTVTGVSLAGLQAANYSLTVA